MKNGVSPCLYVKNLKKNWIMLYELYINYVLIIIDYKVQTTIKQTNIKLIIKFDSF